MTLRTRQIDLERSMGRALLLVGVAAALLGCGDYGGGVASVPAAAAPSNGAPAAPLSAGDPAVSAAGFDATVRPLLLNNGCQDCHAGAGPGSPHIAHPDLETGYQAVVSTQKVNFANPGS